MNRHKFGCRKSAHDPNDRQFKLMRHLPTLPDHVDLRHQMPPVWDQGEIGSCTAHALAAAFQHAQIKQQLPEQWTPSRLMIYYMEREVEGTVHEDAGAELKTGAKVLAEYGVCPEVHWPYDQTKFAVKPDVDDLKLASQSQVLRYARVRQTEADICQTLAQGYPIAFGFVCYDELDSEKCSKEGILDMPGERSQSQGGHAVILVGYDRPLRRFLVRNSWSPDWGLGGYFWMPFDFVLKQDYAWDFWAFYSVEDGDTIDGE